MSTITINFQNSHPTSTTVTISVSNGTFALDSSYALRVEGVGDLDQVAVLAGEIVFQIPPNATFAATLVVPVATSGGGGDPSISASGLGGSPIVTWPTSSGLQMQPLPIGDPLTLSGYIAN